MNLSLRALAFAPVSDHLALVATPVATALLEMSSRETIGVAPIDPEVSDTAAFCERYGVALGQSANCVIVEGRRADTVRYAACVVPATARADINRLVKKLLDVSKISFASREDAVAKSAMEFGAITAIGLPEDWPVFIDAAVARSPRVIIGSGLRRSKLSIPGAVLATFPGVQVVEGLGMDKVT